MKKIKISQPQTKFTGSYKKRVYLTLPYVNFWNFDEILHIMKGVWYWVVKYFYFLLLYRACNITSSLSFGNIKTPLHYQKNSWIFDWQFEILNSKFINPFSTSVPVMDKPGIWFLLAKCLKNTCGRVTSMTCIFT